MPRPKKEKIDPETLEIRTKRKAILKKVRKPRKKSIIPSILKKPVSELTEEEIYSREKIMQDFIPNLASERKTRKVDLTKDHVECEKTTKSGCFRPDIYLDYGCFHCSLYKHCMCSIKMKPKKKRKE